MGGMSRSSVFSNLFTSGVYDATFYAEIGVGASTKHGGQGGGKERVEYLEISYRRVLNIKACSEKCMYLLTFWKCLGLCFIYWIADSNPQCMVH